MRKHTLRNTIRIALLGASFIAGLAYGDNEIEPNDTIGSAQSLTVGDKGSVTVQGVLGSLNFAVADVDFYSFYGQAGDKIAVDIDCAMNCGARGVKTRIAIFGPGPSYPLLMSDSYGDYPLDEGSLSPYDPRIDLYQLGATGTYTVGVTSYGFTFADGGLTSRTTSPITSGDYTLIISGVTPPVSVLEMNIDIKPGDGTGDAPINPKSRGKIPVALLSSAEFNAVTVNVDSLRFGPSGCEKTSAGCQSKPSRCGNDGEDVNGDGLLDLVCHFDIQSAGFSKFDEAAVVTGETGTNTTDSSAASTKGRRFEGFGTLKVTPAQRAE